jgi:BRCT domain type II-containing protein
MLSTISGKGHSKKIAIETTIKTGDVIETMRNTTVPAKYRLASEETVEEIIERIITGAMTSEAITGTHQVPADKIIDQGFQGRIMYHPRIC